MPLYTDDSIERLRQTVDMAELVGAKTELKRSGQQLMGICPFHDERSPSFSVDPVQKVFHCFGCSEGGDLFKFVQLTEGLNFREAVESLSDRYGVPMELTEEDPQAAQRREKRDRLLELLERTAAFYVRNLWESPEAEESREYLKARGLDEALLREFRVGYAPSAWDKVLVASRQKGYSEEELWDAGLTAKNQKGNVYDRFRRRITFPLCDSRGRVLGFGARAVGADQQPKYLNSSENAVFHKGRQVYAADLARAAAAKSGEVILCEGYTDVIAMHQAGLRNTVGLMGTALTEDQVSELARMAPVVSLALDADSAGQEAMIRAAKVAEGRKLELRVVPLPAGNDPADIVQLGGHRGVGGMGWAAGEVEAGAEGVAVAGEGDDPDIVVLRGFVDGGDDGPGEMLAEGVLLFRAVQRDGADVVGVGDGHDVGHAAFRDGSVVRYSVSVPLGGPPAG